MLTSRLVSAGTGCVGRQQLWIVLQASTMFWKERRNGTGWNHGTYHVDHLPPQVSPASIGLVLLLRLLEPSAGSVPLPRIFEVSVGPMRPPLFPPSKLWRFRGPFASRKHRMGPGLPQVPPGPHLPPLWSPPWSGSPPWGGLTRCEGKWPSLP